MMSTHRHQRHTAFLILFALAVTVGLGACETDQSDTEPETTSDDLTEMNDTNRATTGQDTGRATTGGQMGTATELDEDPSEYIGQRVQVEGQIEEQHGQNAFTVDYGWTGGSALVVVPDNVQMGSDNLTTDESVEVTGTVEEYRSAQMGQEYNLPESLQWEEGQPVIIAEDVALTDVEGDL